MATTSSAQKVILGGTSSGVTFKATVNVTSQNIANNTSTLKLDLYVISNSSYDYWDGHGSTFSMNIGSSWYTPSINIKEWHTRGGTYHVATWYYTMNHTSDGSRSFSYSATMKSSFGSGTASGSMTLATIPRASSITGFTANSSLQLNTTTVFTVNIDRKSSSFVHNVNLYHGNTLLQSKTGVGTSTTFTLSTTEVNKIVNSQTGANTTFRANIQTKSGSTNIGSGDSKTLSVAISNTGMNPTVSSFSRSIVGNRAINNVDKTTNNPIEGYSSLLFTVKASAKGARSVSKVELIVTGAESYTLTMNYDSTLGSYTATSKTLKSGTYKFQAKVTDSRGTTGTSSASSYTVAPYVLPTSTNLIVERDSNNQSKVTIKAKLKSAQSATAIATIQYRNTANNTWYTIYKTTMTATSRTYEVGGNTYTESSPAYTILNGTKTYNLNITSTGFSETVSYEFKIQFRDETTKILNNLSTTISTAKQLLTLNQDKGVGIGKVHQKGALDVGGDTYIDGNLYINGAKNFFKNSSAGTNLNTLVDSGAYRLSSKHTNAPNEHEWSQLLTVNGGGDTVSQMIFNYAGKRLKTRSGNPPEVGGTGTWKPWKEIPYMEDVNALGNKVSALEISQGTNSNGEWVRFPDGTQICWKRELNNGGNTSLSAGALYRSGNISWTFPSAFEGGVSIWGASDTWTHWVTSNGSTSTTGTFIQWSTSSSKNVNMYVMAIGRWK